MGGYVAGIGWPAIIGSICMVHLIYLPLAVFVRCIGKCWLYQSGSWPTLPFFPSPILAGGCTMDLMGMGAAGHLFLIFQFPIHLEPRVLVTWDIWYIGQPQGRFQTVTKHFGKVPKMKDSENLYKLYMDTAYVSREVTHLAKIAGKIRFRILPFVPETFGESNGCACEGPQHCLWSLEPIEMTVAIYP